MVLEKGNGALLFVQGWMDEKEHALLALLLQVAVPEKTFSQHLDGAQPPTSPSPLQCCHC